MKGPKKYDQILDALQELMEDKDIRSISVSEIAKKAGIGKGSIYYYFPSKDAILDALVERSYQTSLETAKSLAGQTALSPFMRMALLFEACRSSSTEFLKREMLMEWKNKEYPAAETNSETKIEKQETLSGAPEEKQKKEEILSKEEHTKQKQKWRGLAQLTSEQIEKQEQERNQEQAHVHRKFLTYVISELKPVLTEIIQQGIDQGLLHFDDPASLSELVLIVIAVKLDNYLIPSTPQETEQTLRSLITLLESGTGIPRGTLDFLTIL